MKKAGFLLGLTLLSLNFLFSKELGIDISYAQYLSHEDQPYLELYFAVNGNTLTFKPEKEGKAFNGGVDVTVVFRQEGQIKAADRFRILSPSIQDTSAINNVFIHQERFSLAAGTYDLELELGDMNDTAEHYSIKQQIEVESLSDQTNSSDLLILDSYKQADEQSKFTKSGYELIPMVSSGTYYFPQALNKLSFYLELYNLSQQLAEGEPYLLKYYIENSDNGEPLNEYASVSKKNASKIQPVLAAFNIKDLPTGNYNLVIEAVDRNNEILLRKKEFFFRRNNEAQPLAMGNTEDLNVSGTFVERIDNFDSIYTYVQYLFPISSEAEQNYQKSLLDSRDKGLMQKYFYAFWQRINPANPAEEWKKYHHEVKIANKLYGTRIQKGFMTARGLVYLKYGPPDMLEDRKFEPTMPPYQIWQYNQVTSKFAIQQTNRFFVFAEYEVSTNDYELVHSTAFGELFDSRWKYTMARRGNGGTGPDIDANSDQLSQDSYGSRLNNNMIFKSRSNSNW